MEELQKLHLCMAFLEYIEDNYYYNDDCWIDRETDLSKVRSEIFKEFMDNFNG